MGHLPCFPPLCDSLILTRWGWKGRQAGGFKQVPRCQRATNGWKVPQHLPWAAPDEGSFETALVASLGYLSPWVFFCFAPCKDPWG